MGQFLAHWIGWIVAGVLALLLLALNVLGLTKDPGAIATLIGSVVGAGFTVFAAVVAGGLAETKKSQVMTSFYARAARDLLKHMEVAEAGMREACELYERDFLRGGAKFSQVREQLLQMSISPIQRIRRVNPEFFRLSSEALSCVNTLEESAVYLSLHAINRTGDMPRGAWRDAAENAIEAIELSGKDILRAAQRLEAIAAGQ